MKKLLEDLILPKDGQIEYEAKWCAHCLLDENGEHDFDSHQYINRSFLTMDAARLFAATVTAVCEDYVFIRRKIFRNGEYWQYSEPLAEVAAGDCLDPYQIDSERDDPDTMEGEDDGLDD